MIVLTIITAISKYWFQSKGWIWKTSIYICWS